MIYKIIYENINREEIEIECSSHSIKMYVNKFIKEGGKIIQVIPQHQRKNKKESENITKEEYYKILRSEYYIRYKKGIITQKNYNMFLNDTKDLKKECNNLEELKNRIDTIQKDNNCYLI